MPPEKWVVSGEARCGARSLLSEKVRWELASIFLPWTLIMLTTSVLLPSFRVPGKGGPFSRVSSSSLPDYYVPHTELGAFWIQATVVNRVFKCQ